MQQSISILFYTVGTLTLVYAWYSMYVEYKDRHKRK